MDFRKRAARERRRGELRISTQSDGSDDDDDEGDGRSAAAEKKKKAHAKRGEKPSRLSDVAANDALFSSIPLRSSLGTTTSVRLLRVWEEKKADSRVKRADFSLEKKINFAAAPSFFFPSFLFGEKTSCMPSFGRHPTAPARPPSRPRLLFQHSPGQTAR